MDCQVSHRWWKTLEVYNLLKQCGSEVVQELPWKSESGKYYFIKPQKERGWKKDGYDYVRRHNGIGIREDVEKLKINGKAAIICLYSSSVHQGQEPPMNRRIYKLVEDEENKYLVHYLKQKNEMMNEMENEDAYLKLGSNSKVFQEEQDGFFDSLLFENNIIKEPDLGLHSKIEELQQRIMALEQERITNTTNTTHQDSLDENSFTSKDFSLKIVDFSPEWDYIEGGAKFMLCYQPIKELLNTYLYFGHSQVEAQCVQPGVLKCIVPPNFVGIHTVSIQVNDKILEIEGNNQFEYKQRNTRKKKKQPKKETILDKDEYDNSEVKVRVIERITQFQNFFNQSINSNYSDFNQETISVLDDISDQTINVLLDKCCLLAHQRDIHNLGQFFDEVDTHSFALLHYLIVLGFQACVKTLIKNGANINAPATDGLTGLQIAIILQQEEMVNLLIQLGAIDESFADNKDSIFNFDQVYQNKKILDLIVRGYTLCDSIHNSSEQQSWNEQDDQEEMAFFQMKDIFQKEHSALEKKLDEKQAKHKYFRNYTKLDSKTEQQKEFSPNIPYDSYQNHIKIIQKNVRAWLLRRQYLDIKYATQVLQNYIRNKLIKKHMNPECKSRIKSTVRNWLNLKD